MGACPGQHCCPCPRWVLLLLGSTGSMHGTGTGPAQAQRRAAGAAGTAHPNSMNAKLRSGLTWQLMMGVLPTLWQMPSAISACVDRAWVRAGGWCRVSAGGGAARPPRAATRRDGCAAANCAQQAQHSTRLVQERAELEVVDAGGHAAHVQAALRPRGLVDSRHLRMWRGVGRRSGGSMQVSMTAGCRARLHAGCGSAAPPHPCSTAAAPGQACGRPPTLAWGLGAAMPAPPSIAMPARAGLARPAMPAMPAMPPIMLGMPAGQREASQGRRGRCAEEAASWVASAGC